MLQVYSGSGWLGALLTTCALPLSHSGAFVHQVLTLWTHVQSSCPHLTTTIPQCLRCEYIPFSATFNPCSIIQEFVEMHITEADHHQKAQHDYHAHERSFKVGDSVWLSIPTAGKLEPSWQEGGRSNPSEDPTPTRLVMAQSHGLCTLTSYSDMSNPPSEHHQTIPTSLGSMALRLGRHLLLSTRRWCLEKRRHSLGIQPGIADNLTDCSYSSGRATSGWADVTWTRWLWFSVLVYSLRVLIMHECSDTCVVGPGTRVRPGVEFEIDLSLFVAPSHSSGGSYTYYITISSIYRQKKQILYKVCHSLYKLGTFFVHWHQLTVNPQLSEPHWSNATNILFG